VAGYPVALDEHNVESALLRRRLAVETGISRLFYSWQQKWLENFEQNATRQVRQIWACSDIDARQLRQFAPQTPVTVIPNGTDRDYFQPLTDVQVEEKSLVFVGGLNWHPNLDGLCWFDREVLPFLLPKHPDLRLHIIGDGSQPQWLHKNNLICHGRVEDIRPCMAQAAVFVVPLRIGGGTRLKILNAMAAGCCVVATSTGAEGLATVNGENILIGDSAGDFAAQIVAALTSPVLRKKIGQNAEHFIRNNYDWDLVGERLRGEVARLGKEKCFQS